MIYIKKIMKKSKIKLINILVIIVAVAFIFIILNIYKQSPRYIIKDTVNGHYYHYMGNSFAIF